MHLERNAIMSVNKQGKLRFVRSISNVFKIILVKKVYYVLFITSTVCSNATINQRYTSQSMPFVRYLLILNNILNIKENNT
jgi:hypothetical protein